MTETRYLVREIAADDDAGGQDCGHFALAELPGRLRAAVEADPDAGVWQLPALSDGDAGEELDGLSVQVVRK